MPDKKPKVVIVVSSNEEIFKDINKLFEDMEKYVAETTKKSGFNDTLNYIVNLHMTFLQVLNIMISTYLKSFYEAMDEIRKETSED